jgi:hypothetical protein
MNNWRHMKDAPRDGTMIQLYGHYTGTRPLSDSVYPQVTMGFCTFALDDNIDWHVTGWDWCQDELVATTAFTPYAWQPMAEEGPIVTLLHLRNNEGEYSVREFHFPYDMIHWAPLPVEEAAKVFQRVRDSEYHAAIMCGEFHDIYAACAARNEITKVHLGDFCYYCLIHEQLIPSRVKRS